MMLVGPGEVIEATMEMDKFDIAGLEKAKAATNPHSARFDVAEAIS